MTPERQRVAESIFASALERSPSERVEFVRARCGSDGELLREVESLLEFAGGGEGPLERIRPLEEIARAAPVHGEAPVQAHPRKVGHYHVREVLGEGGMGVVFLAEQERPKRTVALKVIRPGHVSPSILRRFEHEAELLGRLQHPGIAQIFEAGTADAGSGPQPFFAMELVNGRPLTQFAREKRLDTRARLELVRKLCDAVEHAHRRGVIHRDLKPANVLVDESGQPKILDFGVARASESDLGVSMLRTTVGQLVGTLPYMSPEQVVGNPNEIDTRCDVYALGVVLYELLAGRLPHELSSMSLPEAVRTIRDDEPAPLERIVPACRGDLSIITARAMAKDRDRRYQSAAELGAELERHLTGHPIEARRDSALYVLGRQVRRHRAATAGAVAFVALLTGATVVSVDLARREQRANERLSGALTREGKQSEALRAELMTSNIERGKLMAQRGDAAGAEAVLWREWVKAPTAAQTAWALRELYSRFPSAAAKRAGPATHLLTVDGRGARVAFNAEVGREDPIEVWSADLETRICTIAPPKDTPQILTLSPDGSLLVMGHFGGAVAVWDTARGVLARELRRHAGPVRGAVFTPDGALLATGSEDGRVVIHGVRDGEVRAEATLDGGIGAMAITPDGSTLLCVTRSKRLVLLGLTGEELGTAELTDQQVPTMIAVHPSGSSAVVADSASPSRLTVVNLPSLDAVRTVRLPQDVRDICFIDEGGSLAVSHRGIEVLRYPSLEHERFEFIDRTAWHRARPLGKGRYVSVSTARHARLFDTNQAPITHHLSRANMFPSRVRFSPDGSLLAVHGGATVLLLDAHDLSPLAELEGTRDDSRLWCAIAFSPDGRTVAFSAGKGAVAVTDLRAGTTRSFAAHTQRVYSIAFSPDGSLLATACGAGELKLWGLGGEPQLVKETKVSHFAAAAEFSASGESLLVLQAFGDMIECAVPSLEIARRIDRPGGFAADVSPDGASVAISRWKGSAEIVRWPAGGEPLAIGEGAARIGGVRFSRRGDLLATAGFDGAVRLWDSRSGICSFTRDGEPTSLSDVDFAPDDSRLAWVGESAGIYLMDLTALDPRMARHAPVFGGSASDGDEPTRAEVVRGWGVRVAQPPGDDELTARAVKVWGLGAQRSGSPSTE